MRRSLIILYLFVLFYITLQLIPVGDLNDPVVLGHSTVTNTGATVVTGPGGVGVYSGTAMTGWGPLNCVAGADGGAGTTLTTPCNYHFADSVAAQGQSDATILYNYGLDQAIANCTITYPAPQDLGGLTLLSGTYCFSSSAAITGQLTLDAQNNSNAQFIFSTGSTLITASGSSVIINNCPFGGLNGLNCAFQVLWQVFSSATLGTTTSFLGNIVALSSITLNTGAQQLGGKLWARTGAVSLDTNVVNLAIIPAAVANSTLNITAFLTTTLCNPDVVQNSTSTITIANSTFINNETLTFSCKDCNTTNNGTLINSTHICAYRTVDQGFFIPNCTNPSLTDDLNKMSVLTTIPTPGQCLFDCKICTATAPITCQFKCYFRVEKKPDLDDLGIDWSIWGWVIGGAIVIIAGLFILYYIYYGGGDYKKEREYKKVEADQGIQDVRDEEADIGYV